MCHNLDGLLADLPSQQNRRGIVRNSIGDNWCIHWSSQGGVSLQDKFFRVWSNLVIVIGIHGGNPKSVISARLGG